MSIRNKEIINSVVINKDYSLSKKDISISISDEAKTTLTIQSLSNIRQLSNLDKIKTVKEYYPGINCLNISGSLEVNKLLGKPKSREYTKYLLTSIRDTVSLVTDYHTSIFPIRKKCYLDLKSVSLNGEILDVPHYNHTGVTGRTGIHKGYNFLTMKKENRYQLKPIDDSKALVEVDFKSCEPFFYLLSKGYDLKGVKDVYKWISINYNVKITDRNSFKRGILSMIYGANENTISRIMQTSVTNVRKIKEEIGLNKLSSDLMKEFKDNGFMLNYYGRPITSDNNLINYWIQSSAVDYCSLAFYDFAQTLKVDRCFFIHDSMTFQIEKSRLKELKNIKSITEKISNITIPVEFKVYS